MYRLIFDSKQLVYYCRESSKVGKHLLRVVLIFIVWKRPAGTIISIRF